MKPKRKRRYREHKVQLFVASQKGNRIHDFLKGWGTIHKDCKSILWDTWRPPTKRQVERVRRNHEKFRKNPIILLPMIKAVMPILSAADIINVQPMKVCPPLAV